MNKTQEPIFYSQLECPVCSTMNEYENIRSGSYTETGKETDFRPTGITWQRPDYQKYDPLLFFIATCKKCYYSREFTKDYKNWNNDTSFKTYRLKNIKEKHLAEYAQKGVVVLLGKHIDHDKYPFESAMIKLLLAIYDDKLQTRPSNLDQGRFFLRIAWLYRGQKNKSEQSGNNASNFIAKLHGAVMSNNNMLPNYDDKVLNIKNMVEKEFVLMFEGNPKVDEYKKRIEETIEEVTSAISPLMQAGSKLVDVFKDAEKDLLGTEISSSEIFFNYSSFKEFLKDVKKLWDEAPLNEKEALVKAGEYYQKAYEAGGKIMQGIQQIQVAYLIAELSRRVGDYSNATQFFNQTIRIGREMVQSQSEKSANIKYAKKFLEMVMDQARLNKNQLEGAGQ